MAEQQPQQQPLPESQKERWVKYGANVALVSIVAIVLAGLITYLAQRVNRRLDTTASGAYSLKPQTIKQITDLAAAEVPKIATLPVDNLGEDEDSQTNRAALVTVRGLPKQLQNSAEAIERRRKQKPPDLKGAVSSVEDNMDVLSQTAAKIIEIFNKEK